MTADPTIFIVDDDPAVRSSILELVEAAGGKELFTHPQVKRTEDYVEGRFG